MYSDTLTLSPQIFYWIFILLFLILETVYVLYHYWVHGKGCFRTIGTQSGEASLPLPLLPNFSMGVNP